MSDDLVKRLRVEMAGGYCNKRSLKQAADRIEALKARVDELEAIAEAARHVRSLDEDEFEVIVGNCAYHNLRAALSTLSAKGPTDE